MGFDEKVWEQMAKIPKGRVTTYSEIARALGKPKAVRAVGNACGKNPYAPKVPCHRVVAGDGKIGGYSGGLGKKIILLKKEGIKVSKGKVIDFGEKVFRF